MGVQDLKNKAITALPAGSPSNVWSIMEQGPSDGQMRVDGYGGPVRPVTTNLPAVYKKYMDDTMTGFLSNISEKKVLNLKEISKLPSKITATIKELRLIADKRMTELTGRDIASLAKLPGEFKKDAIGTLASMTGGYNIGGYNVGELVRTGKMTYEEGRRIQRVMKGQDWTSFKGVLSALDSLDRNLTGGKISEALDVQGISALVGEVTKVAIDLGLTDIVDKVSNFFTSDRDKRNYLNAGVTHAVSSSNLDMVREIVKHAGRNHIHVNNPNLVWMILEYYKDDELYEPSRLLEYRKRLIDTLNSINPHWDTVLIGDERISDLSAFRYVSKDAKKLLCMSGDGMKDYTVEFMIAGSYRKANLKQLVLNSFKDITFKNRPTDPRKRFAK